MKLGTYTIWFLGALLVIGAMDTQPDPPVVNPGPSVSQILQLQDCPCESAIPSLDIPDIAHLIVLRSVSDDCHEPYRPSDRVLLSGQASDSSPPTA